MITKRHIGSFFELETKERDELMELLSAAKAELDQTLKQRQWVHRLRFIRA